MGQSAAACSLVVLHHVLPSAEFKLLTVDVLLRASPTSGSVPRERMGLVPRPVDCHQGQGHPRGGLCTLPLRNTRLRTTTVLAVLGSGDVSLTIKGN